MSKKQRIYKGISIDPDLENLYLKYRQWRFEKFGEGITFSKLAKNLLFGFLTKQKVETKNFSKMNERRQK